MDIFIEESLIIDYQTQRGIENIVHNTIYRGTFELYRIGENLFVNIQNANYISRETHKDLINQIQTSLKECKGKLILYTYGKTTTIINS